MMLLEDGRGVKIRSLYGWLLFAVLVSAAGLTTPRSYAAEPVEVVDVEPVWTGHPVGFSLLTFPPYQYVAYYDAQRQMTVAQRKLDQSEWVFHKLPSQVGWDSHNYVTMAVDRAGHLHVAGNMHCVPLVYFRTKKTHDVRSLVQVPNMVGPERERRVTYPVFLRGPDGQLIFRYRDGGSGNGDDLYNAYDERAQRWQRLLDSPLTSGEGKMNAYCSQPTRGPDAWYHIVWVWRDTPDCATNHDLSYARSRDLVHWETGGGKTLSLPITIDAGGVVDPVPPHGGIINGGNRLGFDSQNRPVLVYHKYDEQGNTQIYVARLENEAWMIRKISDWTDYRWEFSGGGSIPFEVRLGTVNRVRGGLRIACTYGRGKASWLLDESTLEPIRETTPAPESSPKAKLAVGDESPTKRTATDRSSEVAPPDHEPGLVVRFGNDTGSSGNPSDSYRIQWYSLGPNRDRPRPGPLPQPVMLKVLKYSH